MFLDSGAASADRVRTGLHIGQRILAKILPVTGPVPGLGHRVVLLAAVGVDANREIRAFKSCLQLPDKTLDMFWLGAVDADHFTVRMPLCERFRAVPDQVSLADMLSVLAGEADPIVRTELLRDTRRQERFMEGRLCLNKQDIRSRIVQDLHSSSVELVQHFVTDAVMPPVLGAVRKKSSVRTYSGKAQRPSAPLLLSFLFPPLFPGFNEELYRAGDQFFRFLFGTAGVHKPGDGRLVTAGDPAVRACLEVVQMHLSDQFRRDLQGLCRPQLGIQVRAEVLQRCRHGTVDHHDPVPVDDLSDAACLCHLDFPPHIVGD